ncbi:MAG: hypothetical protein ACQER9_01095 [Nanobdellota archaeon]
MKKYIIAFAASYAAFIATDKLVFEEKKEYNTFMEEHCWFLKTPEGKLPIYDNNQVGSIHYRMKGLMEEPPDKLEKSLEVIRKEMSD